MSEIQSEHLIKHVHTSHHEQYFYIVMEPCNGPTLASFVELRKKLDIDEAREIVKQMVKACAAIRAQKFVHKTLNMHDILLCFTQQVVDFAGFVTEYKFENAGVSCKLTDIGLAKPLPPTATDLEKKAN